MNEPDSYALEEALRLKEKHGGEVIALSMGPERVKQTIKEALAKGADRGIHIADNNFAQLDPLGSAKSLAAAIQQQKHDLVLTGLQSDFAAPSGSTRSEDHTSELQSPHHLLCRLLLEK